jgi:hypothetical protein
MFPVHAGVLLKRKTIWYARAGWYNHNAQTETNLKGTGMLNKIKPDKKSIISLPHGTTPVGAAGVGEKK